MNLLKKYKSFLGLALLITYLNFISLNSIASVGSYYQSKHASSPHYSTSQDVAWPAAAALLAGVAAWGFATGVAMVIGGVNGYFDAKAAAAGEQTQLSFVDKNETNTNFEKFDL